MISFAGFDLTLDSKYRHLQRHLESIGHSAIPQVDVIDRIGSHVWPSPVMLRSPTFPEIGLNQLFWPTGFDRPAIGHFLISKDVHDALVLGATNSGTLVINTTGDTADNVTLNPMYVVSMVPLFAVESGEDYPLYVLTLGDVRWLYAVRSTPQIDPAYPDAATYSFSGQSPGTLYSRLGGITGNYDPASGDEVVASLSDKWEGFSYGTPGGLIMEAYMGSSGRRYVMPFGVGSPSLDVWTQAKDDALWAAIENRVVAGARLTAAQVKRLLPSTINVRSSDGHTEIYTLTDLLGESSTGNGREGSVQTDPVVYNASHSLAVARNWLRNHRGTFDGTINGIIPLPLHGGVDYLLVTHRADQCNTRIVRWGKFYQPNFGWSSISTPVYAIGAKNVNDNGGDFARDGLTFTHTFGSYGSTILAELELPAPGQYEIDFRINGSPNLAGSPIAGAYFAELLVYDEDGNFWEIGPRPPYAGEWGIGKSILTSFAPGPTVYHDIPQSFSLRWIQQLPGTNTFGGVNGDQAPTLKVRVTGPAGTISGWMSLTVTANAALRVNTP